MESDPETALGPDTEEAKELKIVLNRAWRKIDES
jgi:hypothetical protein